MSNPLSPLAMLATSMQAQPGVYALLLGSGVSTGASVPTGWGVVTELVRRIAAVEDPESIEDAAGDPEKWWHEHHGEPLGYSSLLESLAPTPAARQGLLADFFEPSDEERERGIKTPSKGHLAIAELVKRGTVKVIITTNFDRLMEQALDAVGIAPQVIARPEAVNGMKPLVHAPATVIKVHGDYLDLGSRNTPSELDLYPDEWLTLLARVLDEYGLIVSGWSAEWDTALVRLIESAPNRRYPMYWDARSGKSLNAQKLIAARSGQTVPATGADEMFSELFSALEALDRLAEPPLTTAMAVARLKRYLPDPVRRIDLHDLVMEAANKVVEGVRHQPLSIDRLDGAGLQGVLTANREMSRQLCALLVTGVWHDLDGDHDRLWMDVLEHLIAAGTTARMGIPVQQPLQQARLYPALLVQTAVGVVATRRGRDALLIKLATEVMGSVDGGVKIRLPACQVVHPYRVLDKDWVNALPRWNGGTWTYPLSHLLKADAHTILADLIPEDTDYVDNFHGYEYRMSLLHEATNATYSEGYRAMPGEYVGERAWSWDNRNQPLAEVDFRDSGARATDWPWVRLLGGVDAFDQALIEHRSVLENFKYHNIR
ncbi:SIR2 family protein [Modestobacter sp. VKM Ac-2978]|uniref:SIR2 family protein n=1 Tax=Modestobacter sp. VKM Ac-2978 TaxID=3004132 RepID=UPI0022AB2B13|nr:SIR2 family protein [Modestobacter sp. VKM Ac-2978]MCZ2849809.1 SIR2 family protein [Modestobacter sp. VKM Ac-2978]